MATSKKAAFDPSKVKRVKTVTLPTLSVRVGTPVYVRFETPVGKRVINEGQDNERTFQFAQVTNHETGELMNLNVDNGVLWGLDAEYPENGYVGKSFEITGFKEKGQRYMKFGINEIEV